jgi:hypothetical protein
MSQQPNSYTIRQAAALLDVTTEKIHALVRKGKLNARRDEETGRWILEASSVHERLKTSRIGPLRGEASGAGTAEASGATQEEESRFFDLLILLIIGGVTLLAAGYTLLPTILGG